MISRPNKQFIIVCPTVSLLACFCPVLSPSLSVCLSNLIPPDAAPLVVTFPLSPLPSLSHPCLHGTAGLKVEVLNNDSSLYLTQTWSVVCQQIVYYCVRPYLGLWWRNEVTRSARNWRGCANNELGMGDPALLAVADKTLVYVHNGADCRTEQAAVSSVESFHCFLFVINCRMSWCHELRRNKSRFQHSLRPSRV